MIGIIVAMDEELDALLKIFKLNKENELYGIKFLEGNINNRDVVIVKCGIGKVNASRTAQILIDNYKLDYVINVGVAGGLKDTKIGDLIVAERLVQHDFDLTKFNHELGYIPDIGVYIEASKKLVNECVKFGIKKGVIASGDIFVTDIDYSRMLENKFDCDAVEMEGAAIAQVCYLSDIDFIVVRSISDNPNSNNQMDFLQFLTSSSEKIANFISKLVK